MSQNRQTHFKNLAAFASVPEHFMTLQSEGLRPSQTFMMKISCENS